jgi:hypothetical protein
MASRYNIVDKPNHDQHMKSLCMAGILFGSLPRIFWSLNYKDRIIFGITLVSVVSFLG